MGRRFRPNILISSVNLRVEASGTEVGDTFRLLAMRKLEDLPASLNRISLQRTTPTKTANPGLL